VQTNNEIIHSLFASGRTLIPNLITKVSKVKYFWILKRSNWNFVRNSKRINYGLK